MLALGPAWARMAGALCLLYFQGLIFTTGNYGFFNLLTMVLLVPLLGDQELHHLTDRLPVGAPAGEPMVLLVNLLFALFLLLNVCQLLRLWYRPAWLRRLLALPAPFLISNSYGLFAVMTTNRFEFVVEGSDELTAWQAYEFRWKPGDPRQPPRQAAPHQPRLDWQMWFAALDPQTMEPWLGSLIVRLLEGSPPVLSLLRHNPFPEAPPRYIRLTVYQYHFTTTQVRREEGRWWEREMIGRFPPLSLTGMGIARPGGPGNEG